MTITIACHNCQKEPTDFTPFIVLERIWYSEWERLEQNPWLPLPQWRWASPKLWLSPGTLVRQGLSCFLLRAYSRLASLLASWWLAWLKLLACYRSTGIIVESHPTYCGFWGSNSHHQRCMAGTFAHWVYLLVPLWSSKVGDWVFSAIGAHCIRQEGVLWTLGYFTYKLAMDRLVQRWPTSS